MADNNGIDTDGASTWLEETRTGCPDRGAGPEDSERLARIERLKVEIQAGTYKADIRDIALQLARALDRE